MTNETLATIMVTLSVSVYVSYLIYSILDLRKERKSNQSLAIK